MENGYINIEMTHNTRQISLKQKTETEDLSCHAYSTNLFNIFPRILLSFPNAEIRVYLQMVIRESTLRGGWGGVTWQVFVNRCDKHCRLYKTFDLLP